MLSESAGVYGPGPRLALAASRERANPAEPIGELRRAEVGEGGRGRDAAAGREPREPEHVRMASREDGTMARLEGGGETTEPAESVETVGANSADVAEANSGSARAQEAGFAAIVLKPFHLDELITAISKRERSEFLGIGTFRSEG